MRQTIPYIAALLCAVGCTRARDRAPADRTPPTPPPPPAAPAVLGAWEITPVAARGPMLAFALDSIRDEAVYGRVLRSFAGDVVEPVDAFPPFRGRLARDSTVTLEIFQDGYTSAVYRLTFRAEGDSLELLEYRWGPNDQLAPGRRWMGRRIDSAPY